MVDVSVSLIIIGLLSLGAGAMGSWEVSHFGGAKINKPRTRAQEIGCFLPGWMWRIGLFVLIPLGILGLLAAAVLGR